MAICDKGHYYNETREAACPECREVNRPSGPAPVTFLEGAGSSQPRAHAVPVPTTNLGAHQPPWSAARAPGVVGPAGPRTMLDPMVDASRLMGFLVVIRSREEHPYRYMRLKKGINRIGRFGDRAEIEIRDRNVSSEHALVLCTSASTRVVDLDSTNGLFINGQRTEFAELKTGDIVQVGGTHLAYAAFPYIADD